MASLRDDTVRRALELVGRRLQLAGSVRMVIAGGTAALLQGYLQPGHVTEDVDAIFFDPPTEEDEILRVAGEVGRELDLDPDWLNALSRLYFHELPDGWHSRVVTIGTFGPMTVLALSRLDYVAMKFYAHRAEDLSDLKSLLPPVERREVEFAVEYLGRMRGDGRGNPDRIDMALAILGSAEWSQGSR